MEKIRIAVTGSNGFAGNFLCEYFSEKGFSVVGLDLKSNKRQKKLFNFKFLKCDVRNQDLLKQIFVEHKITHVLHLAYLMDAQRDKNFEFDVDVNGSKAVFIAANESKSVRQFVHFSSTSIYGGWKDNPLWISENHPLRPRDWVYAQNKKIVEDFYFGFQKRRDLKLVNLRMCTAVGPSYFKKGGVVKVLHSSPVGLFLDGKDTFVQFIHEDDVKRILDLVVNDKNVSGTFNLCSDSYASARQLNSKKIFLNFPKKLFKLIISLLWHLRIASISPTSVNLVAHGIIASPKKIVEKYDYRFLYSTKSAYDATVRERIKNNTL